VCCDQDFDTDLYLVFIKNVFLSCQRDQMLIKSSGSYIASKRHYLVRCGRFLEKVSTRPHLRCQVFQAGAASLFLSIMSMEHASSYVKESYALALTSLCDDPIVAASWLQDEPHAAQKLVQLLQGHDEELCLNTLSLVARLATVPEGAWALMSAKDLTAQVDLDILIPLDCPGRSMGRSSYFNSSQNPPLIDDMCAFFATLDIRICKRLRSLVAFACR